MDDKQTVLPKTVRLQYRNGRTKDGKLYACFGGPWPAGLYEGKNELPLALT